MFTNYESQCWQPCFQKNHTSVEGLWQIKQGHGDLWQVALILHHNPGTQLSSLGQAPPVHDTNTPRQRWTVHTPTQIVQASVTVFCFYSCLVSVSIQSLSTHISLELPPPSFVSTNSRQAHSQKGCYIGVARWLWISTREGTTVVRTAGGMTSLKGQLSSMYTCYRLCNSYNASARKWPQKQSQSI